MHMYVHVQIYIYELRVYDTIEIKVEGSGIVQLVINIQKLYYNVMSESKYTIRNYILDLQSPFTLWFAMRCRVAFDRCSETQLKDPYRALVPELSTRKVIVDME